MPIIWRKFAPMNDSPEKKDSLLHILNLDNLNDDEHEFIPILTNEEEKKLNAEEVPAEIPILPLKNTVLFPGVVIPITVGRDKSIKLIKDAYSGNKTIGVIAQKSDSVEDPSFEDIHNIGTIAFILKTIKMPDGSITAIIQGKRRFEVTELTQKEPYLKAKVSAFEEILPEKGDEEFDAFVSSLKDVAFQIIKLSPNIPSETAIALKNIESSNFLINFISSNMSAQVADKQKILEMPDLKKRAALLLITLNKEVQVLQLKNQIQSRVREDLDKQQREYFLHQQLKTIQEELGGDTYGQLIKDYRKKAKTKKWGKNIKEVFDKEIQKLETDGRHGKTELLAMAESCDNQRKLALAQHTFYDYSMAMLQIAIVLASASIIMGTPFLLYGSFGVGTFAVLLFLNGSTLFYGAPELKHDKVDALDKLGVHIPLKCIEE